MHFPPGVSGAYSMKATSSSKTLQNRILLCKFVDFADDGNVILDMDSDVKVVLPALAFVALSGRRETGNDG
jgi:hypothetical protein